MSSSVPAQQQQQPRLSVTSKNFDIGNKGYLTAAERVARSMVDPEGDGGRISNSQAVQLIEQTEDLTKQNKSLRRWLLAVLAVSLVLGVSQIITAIVAARLAKDTDVDSSTGLMVVKGRSDTPVVVVSTGRTVVIDLKEDDSFCMAVEDAADLFSSTISGSPTSAALQKYDANNNGGEVVNTRAVSFTASGTFYNSTMACIGIADSGYMYCFDFEPCGGQEEDDKKDEGQQRQLLREEHRNLFHQEMKKRNKEHQRGLLVEPNKKIGIVGTGGGVGLGSGLFSVGRENRIRPPMRASMVRV